MTFIRPTVGSAFSIDIIRGFGNRAVILDEFFQDLNIWHVKAPLINYATIEMHQTDRVLQQF
ncbi:hypothetical protein Goshw_012696, partial [Gossypium schwendimanii]|nr:hypothetical protein [Gossypium schwendimanii]